MPGCTLTLQWSSFSKMLVVLLRVEYVVVVGPPQLSPLLAGSCLHSIPARFTWSLPKRLSSFADPPFSRHACLGVTKAFFLSAGAYVWLVRGGFRIPWLFCASRLAKNQGSKAGSKLYILLDVFFTLILWSRRATAQRWAEKCTFAFNLHNIIQTLTRPPWRYFSMYPGSVPMEKCQENFTTGICSFANAATAEGLCSICVCFRSLIQIFVFLFRVRVTKTCPPSLSQSPCYFKGTRSPCFSKRFNNVKMKGSAWCFPAVSLAHEKTHSAERSSKRFDCSYCNRWTFFAKALLCLIQMF